ncbi:peptidoglycan editing factor PgeF [Clostridium cylindrosporum]|uniref:Purine nucleoside phosphorylase n=1 Tax=Clostridium cylindrosporum DSM 605 TaxID=1121307 RepID=A0A0J8G0W2_CLOCY|nr:peptidoglycan editing factor PgeF [Clostridium cylindrosporum]KMT21421.1 laccase domain-containing protein YlmD [Clostridium cylindrosporum DSM 605]
MSTFTLKKDGRLEYFQSNMLMQTGEVKHFFSTKNGGVSKGEFESLNLGVYTNDYKENIEENFNIICSSLNMNKSIAYLNQEHGTKVYVVDKDNYDDIVGKKGDAIITSQKNIPIGVFTADCVPILLYDKKQKVAAAIHAGWRGVEGRILTETLNVMKFKFQSCVEDVVCAIGPAIGPCCFEVSRDVADKFTFVFTVDDSIYVDLLKEVYSEAKDLNILEENIDVLGKCTVCSDSLFHSYRREKGKTGRIGSFIEII